MNDVFSFHSVALYLFNFAAERSVWLGGEAAPPRITIAESER